MRFYLDPDSGLPHIYQHGVREDEVEQILRGKGEDVAAKDGARMKLGQTHAGRYLQVIYTFDDLGLSIFVITAYGVQSLSCADYAASAGLLSTESP